MSREFTQLTLVPLTTRSTLNSLIIELRPDFISLLFERNQRMICLFYYGKALRQCLQPKHASGYARIWR